MKNNKGIFVAAVVCCVAIITMLMALFITPKEIEDGRFVPPEFDEGAVVGTPNVSDDSWMPIYKEGMDFSAHVCGKVVVKNNYADVFFTNDVGNKVWMKLRVIDEAGNILGETGLIKAGEYVKSVRVNTTPIVGTKIKMKIMAYEPETYYSAGSVSLNTYIGG